MLQHTANDLSLTTASTPPTTFNSTPTTSPTPSSPQTTVDDTTVSTPTPTPEPEPQIPVVSENETLTFAAPNIQVRQSIPRAAKDKCINTLIENRKALSAVLSESIPSAEGDNNYSNLFDNCLKFISNQSDDIETLFDNTRYNFSVEDITQALSGKVLESALLISQDMCSSDSPTLSQAMQGPEADKWTSAIKKEFDTLWNTGTFETVHRKDVPAHQKVISAKIHLRLKHDPVRDLTQHKARFVVRGFSQQEGIDYNDIYSPVASFKSILALLTIGAHLDYEIHQMDFDAAFLNASIKEEVYVAPVGSLDPRLPANHVYRLRKTLYGLKQSPREWWLLLQVSLRNLGWTPTLTDNCIFFREQNGNLEYLAVYVDDIIIVSPSQSSTSLVKSQLASLFKCKDLGELSYVLGVRVTRDRKAKRIHLDQMTLINKYVDRFKISASASTPGFWKSIPADQLETCRTLDKPENKT